MYERLSTQDYLKLFEVSTLRTFSNRKWTGFVLDFRLWVVYLYFIRTNYVCNFTNYQMDFSTAFAAEKMYPTPWIEALSEYSLVRPKMDTFSFNAVLLMISTEPCSRGCEMVLCWDKIHNVTRNFITITAGGLASWLHWLATEAQPRMCVFIIA